MLGVFGWLFFGLFVSLGFVSLVLVLSGYFFLLEVRGYLINHHFKVAWVICIQIQKAASSTDNIWVCVISNPTPEQPQHMSAGGEAATRAASVPPRAADFGTPLPLVSCVSPHELQDHKPEASASNI